MAPVLPASCCSFGKLPWPSLELQASRNCRTWRPAYGEWVGGGGGNGDGCGVGGGGVWWWW